MRITILGRQRCIYGYPALVCEVCHEKWHLSQSVRRDELARNTEQAQAIKAGWTVPDEGPVYCPDHKQ